MASVENKRALGAPFYTPEQSPPAGTAIDPATAPTLYQPLKIRDMTLQNRFAVSPMCQYSADDGHHTDWHFSHLSQFIIHGAALTIVEATAVLANGRITPEDSGLWKDSQIAPLKRIVDFAHSQGQKIGIQLGHAGRKASTLAPWLQSGGKHGIVASKEHGGWSDNVWAPSAIPIAEDDYAMPKEMTTDDIKELLQAFKDAARRAVEAGFDTIEIHGAHGYLITNFMSPITNHRTDNYGGSFENRTRLLFETIAAVREVIPASMPLLLRISATEWMEYADQPSWTLEESIKLAKLLPAAGIDLLDVSSGGNNDAQKIKIHPYYQIDLAAKIREELKKDGIDLLLGAVGMISNAEMAYSIVQEGKHEANGFSTEEGHTSKADIVLMARQFLREPEFPLRVAHQLGVEVKWPIQYHRAGWRKNQKI
ncbi:NADPH dehydrogenase [Xylaria bambusicola]|uniref:NADPH dehydrogenase n=1 Tax=Xylaria bambusicola TaxID=326684 RepID=UPI002007CBF9|nr:NADPH dehydrogenase [Xylaria bambusicola]KAI0526061.1 NADPH dehydrogenase [Xylaria bambusicola]